MTPAERAAERLLRWAASYEPAIRLALLDAWMRIQGDASTAALTRLLEANDVDGVLRLLFDSPAAAAAEIRVRNAYAAAVQALRERAVRQLVVRVVVPVADARLVALVRQWEDTAFRRVLADVRVGLREQVATELARGIGPRQVAVALKTQVGRVGLTAYDERIIASYRTALEEGRFSDALQRALRDKRFDKSLTGELSPAQIEKMVEAYRRKLVALRAETFARTSAMSAANDATTQSWRDAVAQGTVAYEDVKRYWVTAKDERLCPICEPIPSLNPDGVGLDDAFETDNGPMQNPPAHPNCRCSVFLRLERSGITKRARPGTQPFVFPSTTAA